MAQSPSTVWEVRAGSGSDNNGGGFDPSVGSPGTDYSQQDSAQVAFTDLVIGATTTQLTSALNPFTSADVGNVIYITGGSGFTLGFYTVTSVSAGTATMDRSVGTTLSTGGTGNLGGALNTLTKLFLTSASGTPVATLGMQVWATGTQTITGSIWFYNTGSAGADRLVIQGYGTSRGDTGHFTLACSTNSVNMLTFQGGSFIQLNQLTLSNTAGTPGAGLYCNATVSGFVYLMNCKISGCSNGIDGSSSASFGVLFLVNTEITSCTGYGVINLGITNAWGSYVHGNTNDGFRMTGNSGTAGLNCWGCVSAANGGKGFADVSAQTGRQLTLVNCVAYGNTGDGVYSNESSSLCGAVLINNILYDNGGYGFNCQTPVTVANPLSCSIQLNNAFGANTSGARNSGTPGGTGDVTLTANPFNNASSGDFTLNNTSGGGAACTGAGYQSSLA